jgi:hypothetical protein
LRALLYVFKQWQPSIHSAGLPHSETHGLKRICRYPWLIAACRVLHRLLAPRHSSCALRSLINLFLLRISPFRKFVITDSSLATSCDEWPDLNQTQLYLLFVYFSEVVILLLPVCRCQRTIGPSNVARGILVFRVSSSFQSQKWSSCFTVLFRNLFAGNWWA